MAQLTGVKNVGEGLIKYNGAIYAKTTEEEREGDIARCNLGYRHLPFGSFYEVIRDSDDSIGIRDLDDDFAYVSNNSFTIFRRQESAADLLATKRSQLAVLTAEIAELETQLAEESRLKVGDYARVVEDEELFVVGDIVRVERLGDDADSYSIGAESLFSPESYEWFKRSQLEKITPAEARASLIAKIDAHFNPEGGAEPRE